jgi:hypothetical protein
MKHLLIISISLLVLAGGLMLNNLKADVGTGLHVYWFKRSQKEMFRDSAYFNPLRTAIDNSLHFISGGFSITSLPF